MIGLVPRPCSLSAAPALAPWVSYSVSHRIAPAEFLCGGLFVQAPFLLVSPVLPVELCSGRPNCGTTQVARRKVDAGSSCDCSSPGLQVGWLGRECFLSFGPGTPLPRVGNVRLGLQGQASSLALVVLPQLETTAMASTNCVVFSWHHQGRVECLFLELSASHFLRVTRGGRVAWGLVMLLLRLQPLAKE